MTHQQELVGRDIEISRLLDLLDDSTAAPAVIVTGDPGVGKTALVEALAGTAVTRGWSVARAVGVEAESSLPLAGLHQIVHAFGELVPRLPERSRTLVGEVLTPRGDAPGPLPLATGLLDLLEVAAQEGHVLVLVDDAHWLDDLSAAALTVAGRRLQGRLIRLVLVSRRAEGTMRGTGLPSLDVGPLGVDASRSVLDRHAAGLDPATRRRVLEASAGNPLALGELGRSAARRDGDGMSTSSEIPLTERLLAVFGRQVDQLEEGVRASLLRAALDGVPSWSATAGPAGRYEMVEVDTAAEAGLVVQDLAGRLVFRHPLVRSAIVQTASLDERRAAHAELATVYPDDILRRASHLAVGTNHPDEDVAKLLETAAHLLTRRGGAATAVEWLRRAGELSTSSRERGRRLSDASFVAGQSALLDAAEHLSEDASPSPVAAEAALTAAYVALYRNGDVIATHRQVVRALEQAPSLDDQVVERLVAVLLAISQYAADPHSWELTDAAVDALGSRVSELALVHRDAWGDVVRRGGSVRERLDEHLARASELEPWDLMRIGVSAYYVDVLEDFRTVLELAVERELESGAATNAMTMLQLLLLDQIASGQWEQAQETGRRGLALAHEHGYTMFEKQFLVFLGVLAASRGEREEAQRIHAEVTEFARPRRLGLHLGYAREIAVLLALADSDYEAAYAAATEITRAGVLPRYSHHAPRTLLDLVEAAVRTDRHDAANAHLAAARDADLASLSPRLSLLVAGAEAMLAEDEQAGAAYEAAAAHPAGLSFPFELARIRLAQGTWLRRARRYTEAREALARSLDLFEGLGSRPWADRARSELRAAGTAVHHQGGPAPLSAQERRIAELASRGLSNKEIGAQLFLSPRTVSTHLYKVFPKLGVANRVQLRDALERYDGAAAPPEAR